MIQLIMMTILWCAVPGISVAMTDSEVVRISHTEKQPVKPSKPGASMLQALCDDNHKINRVVSRYTYKDMSFSGYVASIIERVMLNTKGFYGLVVSLPIMTCIFSSVKIFSSLWISYQAAKVYKDQSFSFQELGVVTGILLNPIQSFWFFRLITLLMMTSLPDIYKHTLNLPKFYNWCDVLSASMVRYNFNKVLRHAQMHRQLRDSRIGLAPVTASPKAQVFLRNHKMGFLRNLSSFTTMITIASPLVTVFQLISRYAHKQGDDPQQTLSLVRAVAKIGASFSFLYIMWSTLKASRQLSLASQSSKISAQRAAEPEMQEATKTQAERADQGLYMQQNFLVKSRFLHGLLSSVSFALSCYEQYTTRKQGIMEFLLLIASVVTEGGQLFALTHGLNKLTQPLQAQPMHTLDTPRGEF
jgi:hypothetical protein